MAMRWRSEPPPEMYADEPVLFRTGPHWMSQDVIFGLALGLVAYVALARALAPSLVRYAIIPAVPLAIRLLSELPRYWRFETVLTARRLIVNVGTVRDVYHTLWVRDMLAASASTSRAGRVLGYGQVSVVLETTDLAGRTHRGAYILDYVRDAEGLARALRAAMERVQGPGERGARSDGSSAGGA